MYLNNYKIKAQNIDSLEKVVENLSHYLLYRNHDSTYISNYGNEFAIKLLSKNKFNYFRLRDKNNNSKIKYRPARDLSLGLGLAHKYFALDISFSLGLNNNSEFDNPKSFDFQGRLFSSKHLISATLQYYNGYQLSSSSELSQEIDHPSTIREDIRTINFSLQYFYVFNYTKFSLKAPFLFNEVQRKSAGSIIGGATFSIFIMDSDSSVVPPEIKSDFNPDLYLVDVNILSASINVGYMYSFIYKEHFFLTLSLIPGLVISSGDYLAQSKTREFIHLNLRVKLNTMNAIGYNGRRFFTGLSFVADTEYLRIEKESNIEVGHGVASFFVGYRFGKK